MEQIEQTMVLFKGFIDETFVDDKDSDYGKRGTKQSKLQASEMKLAKLKKEVEELKLPRRRLQDQAYTAVSAVAAGLAALRTQERKPPPSKPVPEAKGEIHIPMAVPENLKPEEQYDSEGLEEKLKATRPRTLYDRQQTDELV